MPRCIRSIVEPKVTTAYAVVLLSNLVWIEGIFAAELFRGVLVKMGNVSIDDRSNLLLAIPLSEHVDWTLKLFGLISFCETLVLGSS